LFELTILTQVWCSSHTFLRRLFCSFKALWILVSSNRSTRGHRNDIL